MRSKRLVLAIALGSIVGGLASAQQTEAESDLEALIPYSQMQLEIPGLTLEQYKAAVRTVAARHAKPAAPKRAASPPAAPRYLGQARSNPFATDSTDGRFGRPYSPTHLNNPFGICRTKYGTLMSR